jgi:hypothetical protein
MVDVGDVDVDLSDYYTKAEIDSGYAPLIELPIGTMNENTKAIL